MVTPENYRVLFADPSSSSQVVCIYHNFDKVLGATLEFRWPTETELHIHVQAENGTYLEMQLRLANTLATRILSAISQRTPLGLGTQDPVIWIGEHAMSLLVAKGKVSIAGKTDTGQPFFGGRTDRLMLIKDGTAKMNDERLGRVGQPRNPVAFGDFEATPQAFIMFGDLYLTYGTVD
jgi:hypothetical protein